MEGIGNGGPDASPFYFMLFSPETDHLAIYSRRSTFHRKNYWGLLPVVGYW